MNDIIEVWTDIRDSETYEISNIGRVRNKNTGRILTPQYNRDNGYLRVTIDTGRHYIHRLMAYSFFDLDDGDYIVKHKDGVRTNNFLTNIEVVDRYFVSKIPVVRCRSCKHRYSFTICYGQDDNFYCGYGETGQE